MSERNEKMVKLRGSRTIREVAGAMGIGISTYSMIETGKRHPRPKLAKRIADFYGSSVEVLFYGRTADLDMPLPIMIRKGGGLLTHGWLVQDQLSITLDAGRLQLQLLASTEHDTIYDVLFETKPVLHVGQEWAKVAYDCVNLSFVQFYRKYGMKHNQQQ